MPLPRSRRRLRLLAAVPTAVAALLAGTLGGLPAAGAAPSAVAAKAKAPKVPGDEPLPGYTISNPPLAPLTVDGEQTTVTQGVRSNAGYIIEKPADWNGELLMWAHGFRGNGTVLTVDPPGYGLRQRVLDQGYAWAASSYARNDYDVATGVVTTRDLARYAGRVLGRSPKRTYVAGVSMGGHVIGRSLEQYPGFYDGALPMCGVLGDDELFDYFLSYNLVAQTLAEREAYPPPADYLTADVPVIQQRLGIAGLAPFAPLTNERGQQLRAVTTDLSGGERPGDDNAFAIWKDFLFTLYSPDTGGRLAENPIRVAQNLDTTYVPDQPVDLNSLVRRVAPTDPQARRTDALIATPRIDGDPRVPVLSLHGLGDLFVPFSMEQVYAREVAANGESRLLVQRAIRTANHCEFSPSEVGTAWDDLTDWVESAPGLGGGRGQRYPDRPAGDDVLDPAVVADARYGCRFTDATAYPTGTRGLYQPCG